MAAGYERPRVASETKEDLVKNLDVSKPSDTIFGVALVGLGRSGHFHMTSIRALPELSKLEWVIDVDEEKCKNVSAKFGCKWTKNLDDALADPAVKIVIIASTTDTHFDFIMRSLKAGKAIFAEKPISHDVTEVQKAVDLAKELDLAFVCGYQRRCDKNFRTLKQQLDLGAIGDLKMIKSCSRDNPLPPLPYLATSGGIFQDMLVHDFDMQDWLSGGQAPESVTSVGHCYNEDVKKMDDIDCVAVMLKYESGLITMIDTCRDAAYGYDQRLEAFGSKGMLTAKNEMTSSVELANAQGHMMPPAAWSFPERYEHAYMVELAEFLALMKAGPKSQAHKQEQHEMMRHPRIVRTCIAAEVSYRLGRMVKLSEDMDALMKECGMEHH